MRCGIDEAGRGSIVGPLVICGILIEKEKVRRLAKLGVRDSKLLSPEQRTKLYSEIKELIKAYKVIKVSPKEIDERLEVGTNLNKLEAIKMAELINFLKPKIAILDCPSTNPKSFLNYLNPYLKHKCKLIAENYADRRFLEVAAASIIAKVERDKEVRKIEKIVGRKLGVGYPHDPYTIKFIQDLFKKGGERARRYVRKSWQTYLRIRREKTQRKLTDFDEK
jgi:ribonuclease HII